MLHDQGKMKPFYAGPGRIIEVLIRTAVRRTAEGRSIQRIQKDIGSYWGLDLGSGDA